MAIDPPMPAPIVPRVVYYGSTDLKPTQAQTDYMRAHPPQSDRGTEHG